MLDEKLIDTFINKCRGFDSDLYLNNIDSKDKNMLNNFYKNFFNTKKFSEKTSMNGMNDQILESQHN